MSMVEKVARALMLKANEGKTDEGWPMMEDYAKVAIAAMREPQVEMIAAFWRQKNTGTQEVGKNGEDTSDYDAYRAMIDAALTP